jgi:hypothetical protein
MLYKMDDSYKLYFLTMILDIGLIIILFINNLVLFDKIWIILVLFAHLLFYYGLKENNRQLLDFLHYSIFLFPIVSIFAKNIFIRLISLFLLVTIQVLWVYEKRCILNEEDQDFGYGNEINYFCIVFTALLALTINFS